VVELTHGDNRYDDEIFEHTLRVFPEFAAAPHTSLTKLDEDWMKSKEGKERWREFINACVLSIPTSGFDGSIANLYPSCARARTTDMRKRSQTIILAR
jgi:hypothetical protein